MAKSNLRLVTPATEDRTVMPRRAPRNERKKAPDAVCRTGVNPGSTAAALEALARRMTVA